MELVALWNEQFSKFGLGVHRCSALAPHQNLYEAFVASVLLLSDIRVQIGWLRVRNFVPATLKVRN